MDTNAHGFNSAAKKHKERKKFSLSALGRGPG
jgi:hypothetical protein